jgi:hypothetical protein
MNNLFLHYDNYIKEVIHPLLPSARLDFFVDDNLNLFSQNQLQGSIYDNNQSSSFIHFTSVTSLLEIIRSKKIRMSDFNSFSDPRELEFANSNFSNELTDTANLKSKLFALSMCDNTEENRNNETMWNSYGCDHKGVCIELKLHNSPNSLNNFHLGKIIYSPNSKISKLVDLKRRHDHYSGKTINNLDSLLISVSSMYKRKQEFSTENESRLLAFIPNHFKGYDPTSFPIHYKFNHDKMFTESYLELPLENEDGSNLPVLSIEKIYTGKKLFPKQLGEEALSNIIEKEFYSSFLRKIQILPLYGKS